MRFFLGQVTFPLFPSLKQAAKPVPRSVCSSQLWKTKLKTKNFTCSQASGIGTEWLWGALISPWLGTKDCCQRSQPPLTTQASCFSSFSVTHFCTVALCDARGLSSTNQHICRCSHWLLAARGVFWLVTGCSVTHPVSYQDASYIPCFTVSTYSNIWSTQNPAVLKQKAGQNHPACCST